MKFIAARLIDTILKSITPYNALLYLLFFRPRQLNRDDADHAAILRIKRISNTRLSAPKLSAIYRVKNGASYLELSLTSILPLVSEIVLVDNNSTDETKKIFDTFAEKHRGAISFKYYCYKKDLAIAGKYYHRHKIEGRSNLSDLYNFSFQKGTQDYLMKVDAHYIFTHNGLRAIQRTLEKNPDIIYYRGIEIFGKSLSVEPQIFRKDLAWQFVETEKYEMVRFKQKIRKKSVIFTPTFIHLKRVTYNAQQEGKHGGALSIYN